MSELQQPSNFATLGKELSPDAFSSWSYAPTLDGMILPYAKGVSYFNPQGSTLSELNSRNSQQAESVLISQSGLSVNNGAGLHLGVGIVKDAGDQGIQLQRLSFQMPTKLSEGLSGRQPPIASIYPRVTFPEQGKHPYAVIVMWDANVFGSTLEKYTLTVPNRTHDWSSQITNEMACPQELSQALRKFSNESGNYGYIPQGIYHVSVDVERMPVACVRIDGATPLNVTMRSAGPIRYELPISDFSSLIKSFSFADNTGAKAGVKRVNPLERHLSGEKYIEVPMLIGTGAEQGAVRLSALSLEYQGKRDLADLVYTSLQRTESVAEAAINPHLGLLEVQISQVAKLTGMRIDFEPKDIPAREQPDSTQYLGGFETLRSLSASPTRGLSFGNSPLFNTGKTELANPRSTSVLPKAEAEWDKHLYTFRICLTNRERES